MNKAFKLFVILVVLSLLGLHPAPIQARPLSNLIISQLSPSSCPFGGCSAGQRINIRAAFDVNPLNTSDSNTQVCIYTSMEGADKWADDTVFSITDTLTFTDGEKNSVCSDHIPPSAGFLGGAYAQFSTPGSRNFDFAFRINKDSTASGSLQISIFQLNAAGDDWIQTEGPGLFSLTTSAAAEFSYVTNSAGGCGIYNPCYLNSSDDLVGGIGTGLKDAVDAGPVNATITILGTYLVKGNTVVLSNPQTIRGINDSSLTYSGVSCTNPMLQITNGSIIRELNITDGPCASPSRDLISVNSASDVRMENNDLLNGRNAISVQNNTGNVFIRFNHINGNSGYGIYHASGGATGSVRAEANNIYGNRSGIQVECNAKGVVNHNFWGTGVLETSAISNCTYTNGGRLGAVVPRNSLAPGVTAREITLSETKTGYFSNLISVNGTVDSKVIIVNHGSGNSGNPPFFENGLGNLTACSNFWDIFMSDGNTIIPSELDLFLKYYPDCASSLASIAFCGGADPTFYPLLWFDPKNSVTDQWDTTGQIPSGSGASGVIGQATTCDMANDEIRVTINNDPSRRPNLISDLNYTPFFIGYPSIFSSLTAVSGIAKIDLAWETIAENKVKGYYVTRSLSENGPYYRVSYLIPAKGNQDIGGIYAYSDTGLNNGTTYWYKLEVIDNNDLTIYFSTPLDANTFSMTPMATEISPNNTMAGGIALSITVTGTNFIPSSIVRWDGANLETSFISSTSLTATIPQELVAIAATHQVTVYNPPPGGGTSTAVLFTIKNPVPALREYSPIDPTEIIQSSSAFILTVYGTNFVCNSGDKSSQVRLAGSSTSITIEGCSSTELKARIPTSRISTAGSFTVTVYNPAPGGGTTSGETLKIIALTATITPTRTATRTRTPTTRYRTNTSAYRSPTPYRTRTTTLTRTITGTILITPSATSIPPSTFTPDPLMTGQVTPEPGTVTPTLLPGEPTYTPEPPPLPEEDNQEINVLSWRLLSILRVLGGSVAGIGLLSIPSFWLFRKRVKVKSSR